MAHDPLCPVAGQTGEQFVSYNDVFCQCALIRRVTQRAVASVVDARCSYRHCESCLCRRNAVEAISGREVSDGQRVV